MHQATASEIFRMNLSDLCHKRGISQRKLAATSQLSFVHVNRILRGHVDPSLSVCEQLASALWEPLVKLLVESGKA